ncbi:MAG TPA: FMN-binding negative transcriptional regulator [Burkholderiaceae bacterium]|nr:FMN-binding negative transcriptional regulator [Burkholderiaceae bacterium]
MIYMPTHFSVPDRTSQLAVMRASPFATLVSVADGVPAFSHVPLVVEERGESIALLGHVAIANPHWRSWAPEHPVIAVFHGPNGYVSPRLYSVREAVPTWNYVVVHAQGRLRAIESSAGKEGILKALIDNHDPAYRAQWDELGEEFREKMKRGIVGFEVAVERVDGKFKLSQNRPPQDRASVLAAMEEGGAGERALAEWMRRLGIGVA